MCIPIRWLKVIVPVNTWVIITIGTVMLILGVIIGVKSTEEAGAFFKSGFGFSRNIFSAIFYIFGLTMIVIGIIGSVGSQKRNVYCLLCFTLFIMILASVLFFAGIVALVLAVDLSHPSFYNCQSQEWSLEINQVAYGANQNFCTDKCICYIKSPSLFPPDYLINNGIVYYTVSKKNNINQYNDCPNFDQLPNEQTSLIYYNVLRAAEQSFHCAGWCEDAPIYQYSEVSKGLPSGNSCYWHVNDYIHRYGLIIGITCIVCCLVFVVMIILTCCLCLHPQRGHHQRRQPIDLSPFYQLEPQGLQ